MKKRFISIMLIIIMLLTFTPFAFAATSGTCGNYVNWTYDNGVLTITGNGSMEDYDGLFVVPSWNQYKSVITTIIIDYGVTSIGERAFSGCNVLTSITIPDSVKDIGRAAFSGCNVLTSITLSKNITSIPEYAFLDCTSLSNVTIPNSVTKINEYAFSGCSSIKNITLPASVTSISPFAFYKCTSLERIDSNEYNCNFSSIDGVLFDKNITKIIYYPKGKTTTIYSIPQSVMSIGEYAFYDCVSLNSITIPDSVTTIGKYAFYGCVSLN